MIDDFDPATRVAPCPDEHPCQITKIEINFGLRTFMTREQQHKLIAVIEEIVDSPCNQPLEGVHWLSGVGSKPNFSAIDAALLGRAPDDNVFELDCCARGFVAEKERDRVLAERASGMR